MLKIIIIILLLSIFIKDIILNEIYCDNIYCNKNGLCLFNEKNEMYCKCVENFSKGNYCNEFINQCEPNPCLNDGKCM